MKMKNVLDKIILILGRKTLLVPDKLYLSSVYYLTFGKRINWKNPLSYNEKLQWLKVYNRKPEYTMMVDKYEVKKYVSNVIGEQYIIPTYAVWDKVEDIDFDSLPNSFVLKCTHNSTIGLCVCKNKNSINREEVINNLRAGLQNNFYLNGREWPYKNVKPRIIAEKYMEDETGQLRDYKFFCFSGKVKALFIATDRNKGPHETRFDFFDEHFNHLPFTNGHPNANVPPTKPICFDEMINLAEKLSKGIPHVRIDFYEVNGKIYFGEITFFHWSGLMPFSPDSWDEKLGSWIELPQNNS